MTLVSQLAQYVYVTYPSCLHAQNMYICHILYQILDIKYMFICHIFCHKFAYIYVDKTDSRSSSIFATSSIRQKEPHYKVKLAEFILISPHLCPLSRPILKPASLCTAAMFSKALIMSNECH